MKDKKIKILIAERSDILREGILVLLSNLKNADLSIKATIELPDLQDYGKEIAPYILIISPEIFHQNEKLISAFKEKHNTIIVGLIYSFQHPDTLAKFDELISLFDKSEKIYSKFEKLLKSNSKEDTTNSSETLSSREKEILKLLVSGNTTKQIAENLHLSTHTVNAHRKNIMRKLDIKTVSGLTIYAVLNNIIVLDEV